MLEVVSALSDFEVSQYKEKLVNREDVWYRQTLIGTYAAQKPGDYLYEAMSDKMVRKVLEGEVSCALPALDKHGMCKWAAWDWDHNTNVLDKIADSLREPLGFNPLREGRREGRSGHCWLFFTKPVPASELLIFDKWIRDQLQIDEPALEFFPKQSSPAKIGNGLRMPLSRNLKPDANGARGWFDGTDRDVLTQVKWFLDQPLSNAENIRRLIAEIEREKPIEFRIPKPRRWRSTFDIWNYVSESECRLIGNEHATQCPVCASEGHDRSRNNLHIRSDEIFFCMYGSPGKTHSRQQIIDAFLKHH